MPTFSLIIPAHNEEQYISDTLLSIKQQSFADHETIVVTNGCTDKTENLVKQQPWVKHFNSVKPHVSRARNYGAGKAKGDILVFLDADTLLPKNALQTIHNQFTKKFSVATTKVTPDISKNKYKFAMWFKNFYNSTGFYKGCSGVLICRKKDFDLVNGYNPEIIVKEHKELTNKLLSHGKYQCVNTKAVTSMRRFEKWGLTKATTFWIKQWGKNLVSNVKDTDYERIR
ncbi:glycosyltransferase [Candidatus Woesearchaeota archaeon]|nr:glycosyltransferase [Candidatus Woesearchaeota archaeon]MBT5740016.1 glycosyltransferase [Candidatus Woesearchaeota archaeon]